MDVAELARERGLELLRFAYLLCGDRQRSEDLLQDVLLAMYRRFPGDITIENPVGYARRSLVNANVSRARRSASTEVLVPEFTDGADLSGGDPGDREVLWHSLRHLPPRQRAVLVLRFYVDASDEEIATILGCRRGTIRSLASRALAAMRADPALALDNAEGAS